MAIETVQTSSTKQPGKQETKEEVKTETAAGTHVETKHEVKTEAKTETKQPDTDPYSRVGRGEAIIHRNVMWALGAGVVPIPVFDVVAVTAVQVKLLKELSDLYGLPFKSHIAKKLVYSLISGLGSVGLGSLIGASLSKLLPAIGTTVGVISVPLIAGAFTHAIGKIFLMHFESGGTILDFDPHAMRAHFKQEYEKAKEKVANMQKEQVTVTPAKTA